MASIEHFLHRRHRLVEEYYGVGTEYFCSGCKTPGIGKGYRCSLCKFDLHEYCGTCPAALDSFMHSHPLTRGIRTKEDMSLNARLCNVCRDHVQGLFYRCHDCDFDVHPLCTQLPEYVHHVCDQHHRLKLQYSSSHACCVVCSGPCNYWRYSCGVCGFNIHLQCVSTPYDPAGSTQRAVRLGVPYGAPPPPPPPPPSWPNQPGVPYGSPVPPSWPNPGVSYGPPPTGVSYGPPQPPVPPSWPNPYGGYNYTYSSPYNTHNYAYPPQGGGASSNVGIGNIMAKLVAGLGVGVLSNFVFGMAHADFS